MKKILYLLLALALCACGTKSPRSLDESVKLLITSIEDSTLTFEDYQPVFEEILDSIEDAVLHHPDADLRFFARQLPADMLQEICLSEPEYKWDSILNLYGERMEDILSAWYVQQLVDSSDNTPFFIMSYAAPYDIHGNETRVSFTFSENTNPESKPILFITLPRDAYEDNPMVIFLGEKPDTDYCLQNGNLDIYGNKEDGMSLCLFGDFLNDMLANDEMQVMYMNDKVKNYPSLKDAPYDECLVQIAVDLKQFQQQYRAAHKWMEDYQ